MASLAKSSDVEMRLTPYTVVALWNLEADRLDTGHLGEIRERRA